MNRQRVVLRGRGGYGGRGEGGYGGREVRNILQVGGSIGGESRTVFGPERPYEAHNNFWAHTVEQNVRLCPLQELGTTKPAYSHKNVKF
jgi:hypothetical protein